MTSDCSSFYELRAHDDYQRVERCDREAAARAIYDDISPSTVQLGATNWSGSGVYVGDGTEIVTAAHVVLGTSGRFESSIFLAMPPGLRLKRLTTSTT